MVQKVITGLSAPFHVQLLILGAVKSCLDGGPRYMHFSYFVCISFVKNKRVINVNVYIHIITSYTWLRGEKCFICTHHHK